MVKHSAPDQHERTLLPPGMQDLLPPQEHHSWYMQDLILQEMRSWGYRKVRPPLLEFESSLFANHGEVWRNNAFRMIDPLSQKPLALRCDMTTQVARLAIDRFGHLPRPLRLCYAGIVLRTKQNHDSLREQRQIGAELYHPPTPSADHECLSLALSTLRKTGIKATHVSLSYPSILKRWIDDHIPPSTLRDEVFSALALKHRALLKQYAQLDHQACINGLIEWIDVSMQRMDLFNHLQAYRKCHIAKHSQAAEEGLQHLENLLKMQNLHDSQTIWHIDLADVQRVSYQSGFCFSFFSQARETFSTNPIEIGRGGRYLWQNQDAIGFSVYLEALVKCGALPSPPMRVYLPWSERDMAQDLRKKGHCVISALKEEPNGLHEVAKGLNCQAIWTQKDGLTPIIEDPE